MSHTLYVQEEEYVLIFGHNLFTNTQANELFTLGQTTTELLLIPLGKAWYSLFPHVKKLPRVLPGIDSATTCVTVYMYVENS